MSTQSGQSSREGSVAQPRRHIVKACEGCRQQKIKCNGESPCERCARLSLPCTVRTVARQRRKLTPTKTPVKKAGHENSELLQMALRPVRVTNEATGKTAIYGPTSTVALLHLLASYKQDYPLPIKNYGGSVDTALTAEGFNFNGLVVEPYNAPPTPGLSLTPPLCLTTIPNQILQFFLNRYVGTAWAILPMQSPAQLGSLFSSAYTAFSHNSPPPPLYPLLLYQLAMGSLSTMQGDLADILAQESDLFISAGVHLPDALDLQLSIIMISSLSAASVRTLADIYPDFTFSTAMTQATSTRHIPCSAI